jgi:hypothetical protein
MTITIPNSVTSIGDHAFYNCESLTSITIPDGVTSIGDSAFEYCESLTTITISDGVTSIGDYAFSDCDSLTTITIPNSVTSIGDSAFEYCEKLTDVTFNGNAPGSFGTDVFKYCAHGFTIYYYNDASGFTAPEWNGYNKVELKIYDYKTEIDLVGYSAGSREITVGLRFEELAETDARAQIYFGVYDGGRLVAVSAVLVDGTDGGEVVGKIVIPELAGVDKVVVKALLWDENFAPLARLAAVECGIAA